MGGPGTCEQAPGFGNDAYRSGPATDFGLFIVRALQNLGRKRCDEGICMSTAGALTSQLHANAIEGAYCGWLRRDLTLAATRCSDRGLPLKGSNNCRIGIRPPLLSLC